jgi:Asp/Glu/hydantoin racemase
MQRLLIINPNTSASVTALLQNHAQQSAGPNVVVTSVTARFGAPYIACEGSYAVATHATLDAWAEVKSSGEAYDALLIGCFGDPGLFALQDICSLPVTGLAQAAFIQAVKSGPFAIVTGGARWKPMLQRLAQNLGFGSLLVGIHTVAQSGAELARDPVAAQQILTTCCQEAAARFGAKSIILGGAGLAGMAERIQPYIGLPVIDSVSAGVQHALALPPGTTSKNDVFDFAWQNVSPELVSTGHPAS